jgi:hypothetical protein
LVSKILAGGSMAPAAYGQQSQAIFNVFNAGVMHVVNR